MKKPEEILHLRICDYLRRNYPDVIFRTDFSSGMKMTPGQAAKHKKFQSSRAYPDLFIAEPKRSKSGLFLEIKATNIYRKDGVTLLKNEHIEEQAKMLEKLRNKGYSASFACGFDEAIMLIHAYLGEPKEKKVEF
ncbi:MAG: hypothetical protein Q4A21_02235 [bacterium]|nr:hypothetical protein [bacterium]